MRNNLIPLLVGILSLIKIISGINVGETINYNFTPYTDILAKKVAVSATGLLYYINKEDNTLYFIDESGVSIQVSDKQLSTLEVCPDGVVWGIYLADKKVAKFTNGQWTEVNNCANDIGVGMNGQVAIIGCNSLENDYLVYILNPDGSTWKQLDGYGVKIDVGPTGLPWVVKNDGSVMIYNGNKFVQIDGIETAKDISISNTNTVYIIGWDEYGYKRSLIDDKWTKVNSGINLLASLGIGPYDLPIAVTKETNEINERNKIYSSVTPMKTGLLKN